MANEDIRKYAKESNVKMWQIANVLNINDGNFSRKLRFELSEFEKQKIIQIIESLKKTMKEVWKWQI